MTCLHRSQRRRRRRAQAGCAVAAAAALSLGLLACGGTPERAVVVRVGDIAITKATVDHWTRVIEHGGASSGLRRDVQGTPRQRALALLISSHWLIGEASRLGVGMSESAIDEVIEQRQRESSGFTARLRATGETIADLKLELRSELAGEAIREQLAGRAAQMTPSEVAGYYRAHEAAFSTLEVRVTDLIENLSDAAAADALVKRIGTGRSFASRAIREPVSRTTGYTYTPEKERVVNAIFAARPGVVSRPMLLNGSWSVFVVRKIIPPRSQPLAAVRPRVVASLDIARQHEIASKFDAEYTSYWGAKTSCRSGYVGAGCPQYHHLLGRYEDPFSRRAHPLLSEEVPE